MDKLREVREVYRKYAGMRVELVNHGGDDKFEITLHQGAGIYVMSVDGAKQLAQWIMELMPTSPCDASGENECDAIDAFRATQHPATPPKDRELGPDEILQKGDEITWKDGYVHVVSSGLIGQRVCEIGSTDVPKKVYRPAPAQEKCKHGYLTGFCEICNLIEAHQSALRVLRQAREAKIYIEHIRQAAENHEGYPWTLEQVQAHCRFLLMKTSMVLAALSEIDKVLGEKSPSE
jgi:hypothetical protein